MIYILAIAFAAAGLLTGDGEWAVAAVLLYCTSRVLERLEGRDDDEGF